VKHLFLEAAMPRIKWDSATDGHWVPDDVIEDGKSVRVPMFLMDGNHGTVSQETVAPNRTQLRDTFRVDGADLSLHRPGHRVIGDHAPHSSARDAYVRDLQSAWKMDRKRKPEPDEDDDDDAYHCPCPKRAPTAFPRAMRGLL
jgi:hypothetical protein